MVTSQLERPNRALGNLSIIQQSNDDLSQDFSKGRVGYLLNGCKVRFFGTPRIALEDFVHPTQGGGLALCRRKHKSTANEQLVEFYASSSKLARVRYTDH